jgi:hypothetical protein
MLIYFSTAAVHSSLEASVCNVRLSRSQGSLVPVETGKTNSRNEGKVAECKLISPQAIQANNGEI